MTYSLIARYGAMHYVATFKTEVEGLKPRDKVALRSDRGVELGEVVSTPQEITPEQPGEGYVGQVLRKMTPKDAERQAEIEATSAADDFKFCAQKIADHNLPMKLAAVEHLFGGEKIIFYYLADGRVDFRQLVKDLAAQYRTRIEMRQIGVRDEARLLADYEHCGQEICCKKFIKNLEPVTMRMAKSQKTTLDPSKISGRCGRLMCCLRYEDETYAALRQNLPRRSTRVRTAQGWGDVTGGDILRQTVYILLENGKFISAPLGDILEQQDRSKGRPPETEPSAEERPARTDDGETRSSRRGGRSRRRGRPSAGNGPRSDPRANTRRSDNNDNTDGNNTNGSTDGNNRPANAPDGGSSRPDSPDSTETP